ncbi:helix-turn-helix transcriptional regulator [Paenibacillus sp. UASWS1643]|nr:helix-turn-helix transcriptional regulator [Paenibacillus sp. UASWS1643]
MRKWVCEPLFTEDPNKIFTAYRIIGTKWTIHILCALSQGPKRFGEIFDSIPSISEMILSRRLRVFNMIIWSEEQYGHVLHKLFMNLRQKELLFRHSYPV